MNADLCWPQPHRPWPCRFVPRAGVAQAAARVVVVGGGFGGASVARALRTADPHIDVTLIEPNPVFTACPFSNEVIAGLRDIAQQRFGYQGIAASGVHVVQAAATAVDPQSRRVTTSGGTTLDYDRLILSPGIDIAYDALPGYTRGRGANPAACLESRGADAAAAPATGGDAGWRYGGDVGAGQSVSLPARPL